ncbi:E3 ubiquitin-protein ligase MARCHF3-like [Cylas formicarius]|uniref:E3 ubiquitin-protein ligase MARCHF3-like n=1 Tax=Cylas formicarius TaxID=197179 RepID=UPI0029583B26|nr:E3 ubiquitin-protein ligase MARCHF3-like [Cylas formicarius]
MGVGKSDIQTLATKLSIASVTCRICYDSDKEEQLIAPCHCKGTMAFVHRSCLETWLSESGTSTCELCHQIYTTERTIKYTSGCSIWHWLRSSSGYQGHGVRGDIATCSVITPLAIVITYVCLYSSEYYSQQKFSTVPAARWTSMSLLLMIGIVLVGYYLWAYSVIRLHARTWYNWWQRACVVRYIPSSLISIRQRGDEEPAAVPNNTPNFRNIEVGQSESLIDIELQVEDFGKGAGSSRSDEKSVVVDIHDLGCSNKEFHVK